MKKFLTRNIIIFILIIIIGVGAYFGVTNFFKYQNQIANVDALYNDSLQVVRTKNNELAYRNKVVNLSLQDLRQITIPELQREIDNLNIKKRHVQSFSSTSTVISDTISIPVYDTIIVIDTNYVNAQSFSYNDEFASINGLIANDTLELDYQIKDSIIQVVHKGPYNNWYDWLLFRKRPIYQTITAKNPKTKINYSRVIKIRD